MRVPLLRRSLSSSRRAGASFRASTAAIATRAAACGSRCPIFLGAGYAFYHQNWGDSMSWISMAKTICLEVPGVPQSLAKTKLNEALQKIYNETDWSFQTQYDGWNCPGLVASVGTTTVSPYSDQVIGDAVASAIWASMSGRPFLTELQYRNPAYSLYNIIAYDPNVNAPFGTLTLDRPWMEPISGPGQPYYIYQAYFPVPVSDFTKFVEIRDTTNNAPVSFTDLSQSDLAAMDAQRLIFGPAVPTYAVPAGTDMRTGSPTVGNVMYEIWPHNLSHTPYSFSYKRSGPLLVNLSDTVPSPLTEYLLTGRTKEILYLYKEAQKGEDMQRGSGADWKFLAQATRAEYNEELKKVRARDANLHRDFVTRHYRVGELSTDGYSTNVLGELNVGRANW